MKSVHGIISVMMAVLIALGSCKKDETSAANSSSSSLITILENGRWSVTELFDGTNDETGHFSGYEIAFAADGNATATKEGNSISGNWSAANSGGMQNLVLNFTTYPFDAVTNSWHVTSQGDSLIKSEHVNMGNAGTAYLTLQKLH